MNTTETEAFEKIEASMDKLNRAIAERIDDAIDALIDLSDDYGISVGTELEHLRKLRSNYKV